MSLKARLREAKERIEGTAIALGKLCDDLSGKIASLETFKAEATIALEGYEHECASRGAKLERCKVAVNLSYNVLTNIAVDPIDKEEWIAIEEALAALRSALVTLRADPEEAGTRERTRHDQWTAFLQWSSGCECGRCQERWIRGPGIYFPELLIRPARLEPCKHEGD